MSESRPRAYIVAALRTPVGKYGGVLRSVRPDDLAAIAIGAIVDRTRIDAAKIDEVIMGCANQAGEDNRNVAECEHCSLGFRTVCRHTPSTACAARAWRL